MTESLLSSATPTISIDSRAMSALSRDLLFLKASEANDGMRKLEARFLAFGPVANSETDELLYLDGNVFEFGSEVKVEIGAEEQRSVVFEGKISAIQAEFSEGNEPEVIIFAEDKLMQLRLSRHMKTYKNVSDAQIAEEIAAMHGLNIETDVEGPSYDVVQQWNMSDLAFLRDRARRIQADVWLSDDTLYFSGREQRDGSEITLVQGNHLIQFKACADLANQRSSVQVCGYDASSRILIDETADSETIRVEAPNGRTGVDILSEAFSGEHASYRLRDVPLNAVEAEHWSNTEMLRRARSFVTVSGTTRGTPEMTVGSRLRLERVGSPFEGPGYYVVKVCHSHDLARGYRTEFVAQRAVIGVDS